MKNKKKVKILSIALIFVASFFVVFETFAADPADCFEAVNFVDSNVNGTYVYDNQTSNSQPVYFGGTSKYLVAYTSTTAFWVFRNNVVTSGDDAGNGSNYHGATGGWADGPEYGSVYADSNGIVSLTTCPGGGGGGSSATSTPEQVQTNIYNGFILFFIIYFTSFTFSFCFSFVVILLFCLLLFLFFVFFLCLCFIFCTSYYL